GSLEGVIAAADRIGGKVGENLRACLDQLPMSKELTRIRCDVPLDVHILDLCPEPEDREALRRLFERLEFKAWLEELGPDADGEPAQPPAAAAREIEIVTDRDALERWLERLERAELIALGTTTSTGAYMDSLLTGFAFADEPGHAAYVPVAHEDPAA